MHLSVALTVLLAMFLASSDGGFDEEEDEEEPEDILQAWDDLRYIQEEEERHVSPTKSVRWVWGVVCRALVSSSVRYCTMDRFTIFFTF